jgi:hypothetical protein
MIGFFDPFLPLVFICFLGAGLAFRSFASAASNLSFSTFNFSPCYYGGCGGIRTPETCSSHVCADYRSGPFDRSGTHPHVGVSKLGFVASRILAGKRCTKKHAAFLGQENTQRRASCFLIAVSGYAHAEHSARCGIFSCIAPHFLSLGKSSNYLISSGPRTLAFLRYFEYPLLNKTLERSVGRNRLIHCIKLIASMLVMLDDILNCK